MLPVKLLCRRAVVIGYANNVNVTRQNDELLVGYQDFT